MYMYMQASHSHISYMYMLYVLEVAKQQVCMSVSCMFLSTEITILPTHSCSAHAALHLLKR